MHRGCLPNGGARGEDFARNEIPHPCCVLNLSAKIWFLFELAIDPDMVAFGSMSIFRIDDQDLSWGRFGSGLRRESVVGGVWQCLRVLRCALPLGDNGYLHPCPPCTMIYLKFQLNEIKSIMEIAFAGTWEDDSGR